MSCEIKIYYFCTEEITASNIVYVPQDAATTSDTFCYQKGSSQVFSQPAHLFFPNKYADEELQYNNEKDIYPVVIHCVINDGGDGLMHSHSTICVVDHHTSDSEYHLRAMKQKIFVDGLCYLLQEIYGIENKILSRPATNDDDEDNGSECVICICEPRDTLILPCRHLCLCNSCADSLRYQANNCPICRAPFRALLQIRAVQKSNTPVINMNPQDSTENIPLGYSTIPLLEGKKLCHWKLLRNNFKFNFQHSTGPATSETASTAKTSFSQSRFSTKKPIKRSVRPIPSKEVQRRRSTGR